ncbi:hypothetical protein IFM89_020860 [Coptis chinensis]|uniref:Cytochrome P450 n=1 Tax=Coptis chinensis TaxID=261450 RepID=A0A835IXM2_9MAGN|nr:hypothetical protein IFM89_020860 [Coptis chinensis]
MEYLNILVWISLAWACLHVLTFSRFSSKLPPGPFPLPIFGNIFKLGKMRHKSLAELAETYGPLMTLKLGSLITIVVSSANMAKEVLQKHDQHLSARTIPDVMRLFNNHETSLIWLPATHKWRNLRQICASQLFTTKRLNDSARIRFTKVMDLMDYVQDSSRSRRVINIGQIIFSTTLNMISNTMFSMDLTPLDSDSAHAQEYKAIVWETMEGIARPNIVDYFPLLRPFDPQGARRRATILFKKYDTIFETIIDKRIQSKEQGDSKDLLDTLLQLLTQENGSTLSHFDMKTLLKHLSTALQKNQK